MNCSIFYFYHCDLGPGNIIVDNDAQIVGILDWETAGFVPREWIRTKFCISSGMDLPGDGEKRTDWRRRVQKQLEGEGSPEVADTQNPIFALHSLPCGNRSDRTSTGANGSQNPLCPTERTPSFYQNTVLPLDIVYHTRDKVPLDSRWNCRVLLCFLGLIELWENAPKLVYISDYLAFERTNSK